MTPKLAICAPSHNFVGLNLRNRGMYQQWKKTKLDLHVFAIIIQAEIYLAKLSCVGI